MSELTPGLGCVKDLWQLTLELSGLLAVRIPQLVILDLGSAPLVPDANHAWVAAPGAATHSF